MTIELTPNEAPAPIALDAFLAKLGDECFDGGDEAAYVAMAPHLAALAADRRFLGDIMIDVLKDRAARQERDNDYGPQVVLLHRGPGWFVRANLWPDAHEPLYRASGARRFFYGVPHDHNFCFLTAGYFGPGYWSDYYEIDHDRLLGHAGETAGLRFAGRSRLSEGRLLLYRAHVDVHCQWPPDTTSISLNLVQATMGQAWHDQYRYDTDRDRIAGQLATSPAEALIALLPSVSGAEGQDLLDRFSRHHPSDRIRFGAIAALASTHDRDGRIALFEQAARGGNRAVAALAAVRLDQIERGRHWVDRPSTTIADR